MIVRRLDEQGRHDEARAQIDKALELAPESWEVNKEAARLAKQMRDIERATRHFEKAVEVMESDFHAWALLSTCYLALGDAEKVRFVAGKMVSEAERALQHDPSNGAALGILAGGFAILGEKDRAREWIQRAMLIDPDNLTMRYNFACVLAGYVGDKDEALRLLEGVLALAGGTYLKLAQIDPDLDCLHDDPRFETMLDRARSRHAPAAKPAMPVASPPAAS